jgi:hypothetical protein
MGRHMQRPGSMFNAASTNTPVDKPNVRLDAWAYERQRPSFKFRPDPGLVACAFPCGGAMARLVIR